jgi:four helix bundle protein
LAETADSSGSNLVEGDGRYSHKEAIRFFYIARGSAREARFWIKRAKIRGLMAKEKADSLTKRFDSIIPKINSMISTRRKWLGQIHEESASYSSSHDEDTEEYLE